MKDVIIINAPKQRLEKLEGVISRGRSVFYEVGMALNEIRHDGLYKSVLGYDTFSDYCTARWDFTMRRAEQLMQSANTIELLTKANHGSSLNSTDANHGSLLHPANERQIRPLTRLTPDLQCLAWQRALETAPEGKITAAHISKVVREIEGADKKNDPIKPEIKIEEVLNEEFRAAFDAFFRVIRNAKHEKFETTSKEAILQHLNILKDVVIIS